MRAICPLHVQPVSVVVRKGFDSLEEMNDVEADLLDRAGAQSPTLVCLAK